MFLPGHYKVSFNIITYEIHILVSINRVLLEHSHILIFSALLKAALML